MQEVKGLPFCHPSTFSSLTWMTPEPGAITSLSSVIRRSSIRICYFNPLINPNLLLCGSATSRLGDVINLASSIRDQTVPGG